MSKRTAEERFEFVPPERRRGGLWTCQSIRDRLRRIEDDVDLDTVSVPSVKRSRLELNEANVGEECRQIRKWSKLSHNGPLLAPPYEKLPIGVRFLYNAEPIKLSEAAEEVATLYAKNLESDFSKNAIFQCNFFKDFRNAMSDVERARITNFELCNFEEIHNFYQHLEKNKKIATSVIERMNTLDKDREKAKFAFCIVNGFKEKIGNYHVEPPGIFHDHEDHPKMGKIRPRIRTEDIKINCSADQENMAAEGRVWKEVINDPYVSWMASWTDRISSVPKYIKLSPASHVRYTNIEKFEVARRLGMCIDNIRERYEKDWFSPNSAVRQTAVALYLIDKFALRGGYEKDCENSDSVGCCTLRVEHVDVDPKGPKITLRFIGKDSIWFKKAEIVKYKAFECLKEFIEGKGGSDLLFDVLTAQRLANYLRLQMTDLTPKVFRTYQASVTLQNQLDLLTTNCSTQKDKLNAYTEANRAVAILCNHQCDHPKNLDKSLAGLKEKILDINKKLQGSKCSLLKGECSTTSRSYKVLKKCNKAKHLIEKLAQLKVQKCNMESNSISALGNSKFNYIDPRISVAWCKANDVPINKIFSPAMMEKCAWAVECTKANFRF